MASTLAELDPNILEAFRTAWRAVVKCTTGVRTDVSVAPGTDPTTADYVRTSGSFLDEKYDMGDEVNAVGAGNAGNNGRAIVTYVDTLTLSVERPWPGATPFVTEAAGASIALPVGVPEFVKYDGWLKSPNSGRPWFREHHQTIAGEPISLRALNADTNTVCARVRQQGIYWLTVFYPANVGSEGASRLRGKIMALIYPAVQLIYAGQLVRVQAHRKKDPVEENEWVGMPVGFQYIADTFNPA